MKRTPPYTLPNGRQATSREYRERMALLKAREKCPDCDAAATRAIQTGDYRSGACQCPTHRS
jgi:hypothetical protein